MRKERRQDTSIAQKNVVVIAKFTSSVMTGWGNSIQKILSNIFLKHILRYPY
jgi:hypothetical protein